MAMVNIPSTCDDPSYRYKMPRIVSKKEGRGNGSKTCIVNMSDVAHALRRPPQYTTKWFGAELGAQSTYTNKEGEGERAIVNGHHDTPIFQTMLDKFIDKYVLCDNCKLPEIDMTVKKGNIVYKCSACGSAGELDNNHKIAAFVSKNPPDETGHGIVNLAESSVTTKEDKEKRRKEREEKRKKKAEAGEGAEDDEEEADEDKEKRRSERRAKKESGEKKEKKERSGERKEKKERKEKGEEGEDGEKKPREKKEKKERSGERKEKKERSGERKEKKERTSKKKAEDSDNESGDGKEDKDEDVEYDGEIVKAVIEVMKEFVTSKDGKAKPEDFFEELRMQQLAKLFDHKIRFYIALEGIMPAGAMNKQTITDAKPVLSKVLAAVKIPAGDVLWCFDAYLSRSDNEKSVKTFPLVLKEIYDEEWVSEASMTKYYDDDEGAGEPGFDAAKKSGAPFITWLKTVEESDDDDEDGSGSEEDSD